MAKLKKWTGVNQLGGGGGASWSASGLSVGGGAGQSFTGRAVKGGSFGGGFGTDKGGAQKRVSTPAPAPPRRRR